MLRAALSCPLTCTAVPQADVAVLVISSRKGEYETGFEKGGQTREHAQVCAGQEDSNQQQQTAAGSIQCQQQEAYSGSSNRICRR